MKKIITLLAVSGLLFASETSTPKTLEAYKQEGVKYIKMLGGSLQKDLKAQMKVDPSGLSAMVFCTQEAHNLTEDVNKKLPSYATVRRAALKARSSANKADELDLGMMQKLMQDIENNKEIKAKPVMVETLDSYRVYKPLLIQPVCLKCHGDENKISSDIKKVIVEKYPQDMATGFKVGDFRGVVVAEIKK